MSPASAQSSPASTPASAAQPFKKTQSSTSSRKQQTSKATSVQPEPETSPQAAVVPPTPEELPPTQPDVSYQNGQLTILSENSTLAQVLRSVQAKTGASFEIPSAANSERVVAQLGPGEPRDVLSTLLNGSKFDYIILGVDNKPGAVQMVILTPRQNGPGQTQVDTAQNMQAPPQTQPEADDDSGYVTEPPPEENPADAQNGAQFHPSPNFIPTQIQEQPGQVEGGPGIPQGGPQQAKTPEQLLQELQRMQQQQQQYQQQLNPANQAATPEPIQQPQPQ